MKKSFAIIAALLVLTSCSKPSESKETTVPESKGISKVEAAAKSVQQEDTAPSKKENTNNQEKNESSDFGQYQMEDKGFSQYAKNNAIDTDYKIELDKFQAAPEFSTLGWVELENKYVGIWDKELNNTYKKLLGKLNDNEQEKLRNAQRGWLQFHMNESEFVNAAWDDLGLGSQGRVQQAMQVKDRIRNRTFQLMEYYHMLGGQVEFLYE